MKVALTLCPFVFCSWFLKFSGMNTRKVYITGLVMAVVGLLLMADWQAIGYDSCMEGFAANYSCGSNPCTYVSIDFTERRACEQLSTDDNLCLWNQYSRVTGEYCSECFKVCRSERKSLNLVQFFLGLALYTATIPLILVTSRVLVSEVTPKESMVCLL